MKKEKLKKKIEKPLFTDVISLFANVLFKDVLSRCS